jgi:hypothetical protein
MKSRTEYQIDPKKVARFNQGMGMVKEVLLEMVAEIAQNATISGQYMGTEAGWAYVQRGYAAAEKFPKLYDSEEMTLESYKQQLELAQFIIGARKDTLSADEWAKLIGIVNGQGLMDKTDHIRKRAQAKRSVNPEYASVSDELNALYEKRLEKATETRKKNESIKKLKAQIK